MFEQFERQFQSIFQRVADDKFAREEALGRTYKPWVEQDDNSADQDYIVGQSGTVQVIKDGTVA